MNSEVSLIYTVQNLNKKEAGRKCEYPHDQR